MRENITDRVEEWVTQLVFLTISTQTVWGFQRTGQVGSDSWRTAEYDHESVRVSRKNSVYRELFRIFVHR